MRNQTALSELALSVGSLGALDGSFGRENGEITPNSTMQEALQAPAKTPLQQAFLSASAANDRSFAPPKSRAESRKELTPLEDADLLRRFQAGNEDAFYVLFERRHKEIYTHCFRMCSCDGEKAQDAFQETFIKVFARKDLFAEASNGRAWLYRIATNTCLNLLRYDRRHPHEGLDVEMNSVDQSMQPDFGTEQESLRGELERAIAKLPIDLREPFVLRELQEFSYEDVSEQLGISVAACRQRVYRAKQMLREELEEFVTGETPKKKKGLLSLVRGGKS
jgi:RNA polymerase sigma-70 factor (ECF subfamily)